MKKDNSKEKEMVEKVTEKKEEPKKKTEKYPGVKFDHELKKYIATHPKAGMICVSTNDTFEQAKSAMIEFEKG